MRKQLLHCGGRYTRWRSQHEDITGRGFHGTAGRGRRSNRTGWGDAACGRGAGCGIADRAAGGRGVEEGEVE